MKIERALFDLFSCDADIPAAFDESFKHTCAGLAPKTVRTASAGRRKMKTVLVAAAAIAVLAGIAVAAVGTDFFRSAFGSGVADIPAVYDAQDKFTYPANERVPVDAETAEKILSGKVQNVQESKTVGGFTFTVEGLVADENGIACLTYTIENPAGVATENSAAGQYRDNAQQHFRVAFNGADSKTPLDDAQFLDSAATTPTRASYVAYLTPFGAASDEITATFLPGVDGTESISIRIPITARAASRTFTDGNITAKVSPIGIVLNKQSAEHAMPDLTLETKDGEYIVTNDGKKLCNMEVSSCEGDHIWLAFNRLVDPAGVTEVRLGDTVLR